MQATSECSKINSVMGYIEWLSDWVIINNSVSHKLNFKFVLIFNFDFSCFIDFHCSIQNTHQIKNVYLCWTHDIKNLTL